jgi:hypothetical protein
VPGRMGGERVEVSLGLGLIRFGRYPRDTSVLKSGVWQFQSQDARAIFRSQGILHARPTTASHNESASQKEPRRTFICLSSLFLLPSSLRTASHRRDLFCCCILAPFFASRQFRRWTSARMNHRTWWWTTPGSQQRQSRVVRRRPPPVRTAPGSCRGAGRFERHSRTVPVTRAAPRRTLLRRLYKNFSVLEVILSLAMTHPVASLRRPTIGNRLCHRASTAMACPPDDVNRRPERQNRWRRHSNALPPTRQRQTNPSAKLDIAMHVQAKDGLKLNRRQECV